MKKDKFTQCMMIYSALLKGKKLSEMKAFEVYGMTCLAQRIHDLRKANIPVETTMKKNQEGKKYAEYSLSKEYRQR